MMKRDGTARSNLILFAVLLFPGVWAALLTVTSLSGGLPKTLENLKAAMNDPFNVHWVDNTPKFLEQKNGLNLFWKGRN